MTNPKRVKAGIASAEIRRKRTSIDPVGNLLRRFNLKVTPDTNTGCHIWHGAICSSTGYGRFGVAGINCRAHRVAWELANGPIPNGLCVLHHCDNRKCVNPSHLFIGTKKDNVRDMWAKGRQNIVRGEIHPKAKLRSSDIPYIRSSTLSNSALARHYGVTHKAIAFIRERVNWKHI